MKKFISIILALTLALTLGISAFADEVAKTQITFDKEGSYVGYQLMTAKVALREGDTCENNQHDKDCYTYSYKVTDNYTTIVDLEEISLLNDTDMQAKANEIYNTIIEQSIESDIEFEGNSATVDYGYWLFADVTNSADRANSLVMVKTAGELAVNIQLKTALPTFNKYVEDVNDSTGDKAWGEVADYDMGDNVPFKLTATIPEYFASYNKYTMIFEDTLDSGFDLNEDITVKVYKAKDGEELTIDENDYTVNVVDNKFTVTFYDINEIADITKDAYFEITYFAELKEAQTIEVDGYANNATLKFSNDPYSNALGTMEDTTKVYTYKLLINKVDEEGNALKGAGFTLYKLNDKTDKYEAVGAEIVNAEGNVFEWYGLDDGNYKLVETTVPDGYNKMGDKEFSIDAEITLEKVTALESELQKDLETLTFSENIKNQSGTILPETGAQGTMWLIFGGAMLVIVAGVFMITRKKMSIYED